MGLTIGVDVGGTKVLAGVVDEVGQILEQERQSNAEDRTVRRSPRSSRVSSRRFAAAMTSRRSASVRPASSTWIART